MKQNLVVKQLLVVFLAVAGIMPMWGAETITWELVTDYSTLTTTDIYVIAGNIKGGTSWYALKNNQVTSASNLATTSTTALTISNSKITSSVDDNFTWQLESTSTSGIWYIKSTKGAYYLQNAGATGSKIASKSSTDGQNQWKIHYYDKNSSNVGATALYNVGVSRELACYANSNWRCYASTNYSNISNAEVVLYKKVVSGGSTKTLVCLCTIS